MTDVVTTLKILLVGESGVGKSSIMLAFTTDTFNASFPATVGVDFKTKVMDIDGVKVKLAIYDTAGQERFRAITSSYYRDAHGAILVYDVTEPSSLSKLTDWVEEVQVYATKKDMVCLVVGNKIDQPRKIDRSDGQEFARKHRMFFMESSAKTKEGINLAFEELVRKILETPGLWESQGANGVNLDANWTGRSQDEGSCYCVI